VKLYLAGPLFSQAERDYLDVVADALSAAGHDPFVPHRQDISPLDPATVYSTDSAGLRGAQAVVAWLDGPMVDDGTACEIGIFAELCRRDPVAHRGIVGLATDWRTFRRRDAGTVGAGLNLFVAGVIEAHGSVVFDVADVLSTLAGWER
jgi:nucleoside 2-deoxyribosyltransferase